jgi:hypothetical protein
MTTDTTLPGGRHALIDARNRAAMRMLADKLEGPDGERILDAARDRLVFLEDVHGTSEYILGWHDLLYGPLPKLLDFLRSDNDRLTAFAQADPFIGDLSEDERQALDESFGLRTRTPRGQSRAG